MQVPLKSIILNWALMTVSALAASALVHGPDADGGYGDLEGTGGVEAVVNDATGTNTGVLSDMYGHIVATVSSSGTINRNPSPGSGYGPQPDTTPVLLDGTHDLTAPGVLGWRSKYLDGTGFYYLGNRYYDPSSGTFLSCDPLGHAASMDLYSYCGGDPVNNFDADGLLQSQFSNNLQQGYGQDAALGMAATGALQDAAVGTGSPYLAYPAGVLNSFSIVGAQMISPQVTLPQSFQANYQTYGDSWSALNATINPAFSAEAGGYELYSGMGISADNFGLTLNSGQKMMSGFRLYSGTVGTVGVAFGGAGLARAAGWTGPSGVVADGAGFTEKFSASYGSYDEYFAANNPQAKIDALVQQYGLDVHLAGKEVQYGGAKLGVSGGVHPLSPNVINIYDEGLAGGDRHFVETLIEEAHHSKLLNLYPESGLPANNAWWNSVVEPRAKSYAKTYADGLFGQ